MAVLDLRTEASASELRWFGLTMLALSAFIAGIVYLRTDAVSVSKGIVAFGALLCVTYYSLRPLRVPIYRTFMKALFPIGWVMSHAILVSIYYLVLTPIGLVLRLVGYDPLQRGFDENAESYWNRHDPAVRPERYFRQF